MYVIKISERGQMVIPQHIRKKLDLDKGRRVFLEFSEAERTITLRPVAGRPGTSLRGFLRDTNVTELRRQERRRERLKDEGRKGA